MTPKKKNKFPTLPTHPTTGGSRKNNKKKIPPSLRDDFPTSNIDENTALVDFLCHQFEELRRRTLPPTIPVYQFLIVIKNIEPKIWRRILVPADWSFFHLHLMVREVMGWCVHHLHYFELKDKETKKRVQIGQPFVPPDYDPSEAQLVPDFCELKNERSVKLKCYFKQRKDQCVYRYDHRDCWEHKIWLEEVLIPEQGEVFPKCVNGARSRPPENVGGPEGYYQLLEILRNKDHPQHHSKVRYLSDIGMGGFDPEEFSYKGTVFGV